MIEGRLPDGWDADVPSFRPDDGPIATRKASKQVIQWAAERVPHLVGGSADLAPSTLTLIEDGGSVKRGRLRRPQPALRHPRARHGGDRERPHAARVARVRLDVPQLLDYMKGAVRLAALMHLPSIFVFTHDSIGLGEDGPTHQPIEQLAHLRATPNLNVVRPADANETALAWRFAIEQDDRPVALALSRQGLPILDPTGDPRRRDPARRVRAARVVQGGRARPDPDRHRLGGAHLRRRRPSCSRRTGSPRASCRMPCFDRFAEQDEGYRDTVLPPACRARVSVEAAATFGWERWVTEDGESIGMTASARPGRRRTSTSTSASRRRTSPSGARRWSIGGAAQGARRRHGSGTVNERLAALTAAGTSVWLDQIRRSLIERASSSAWCDEDSLRGVTSNPAIFEKAILGSDRLRRGDRASSPARASTPRQIYEEIAIKDVQLAARRAAAGLGRGRRRRRLRLARGRAGPRARHRGHARAGARALEAGRPPERDDQDPGHRRGRCPAIEDAIAEGINVNVTLLFSVEAYERVTEAFINGLERRHEARRVARRALRGQLLRLARGHRGRQAAATSWPRGPARHGRRGERPRRLHAFKEIFRGERFAALRGGGLPRSSARCGPPPASRTPQYPETKYVDELVRPATR